MTKDLKKPAEKKKYTILYNFVMQIFYPQRKRNLTWITNKCQEKRGSLEMFVFKIRSKKKCMWNTWYEINTMIIKDVYL